jgi:hypothetical protein
MGRFRIDRGEWVLRGDTKKIPDDPRKYASFSLNVPTPDDWNPTLEDGTVEVSVLIMLPSTGGFDIRTCVWGGDDTGMERDETCADSTEMLKCYLRRVEEVSNWGMVTKQMLKDLGFKSA